MNLRRPSGDAGDTGRSRSRTPDLITSAIRSQRLLHSLLIDVARNAVRRVHETACCATSTERKEGIRGR
jgi:hypothetical protein